MILKPIKLKKLLIFIGVTLLFGLAGALLGGNTGEIYNTFVKPPLSPPGIVFPIVWTILYVLMGIAAYLISENNDFDSSLSLRIYWLQLIANAIWPFFFWKLEAFVFSSILIVFMLGSTIFLILRYYKSEKLISYLLLPYALWLIFALYLNIGIAVLN